MRFAGAPGPKVWMKTALLPAIISSIPRSDAEVSQRMFWLVKGCRPSCNDARMELSSLPSDARNVAAMAATGLSGPNPRIQSFRAAAPSSVPTMTVFTTDHKWRSSPGTSGRVATANAQAANTPPAAFTKMSFSLPFSGNSIEPISRARSSANSSFPASLRSAMSFSGLNRDPCLGFSKSSRWTS